MTLFELWYDCLLRLSIRIFYSPCCEVVRSLPSWPGFSSMSVLYKLVMFHQFKLLLGVQEFSQFHVRFCCSNCVPASFKTIDVWTTFTFKIRIYNRPPLLTLCCLSLCCILQQFLHAVAACSKTHFFFWMD